MEPVRKFEFYNRNVFTIFIFLAQYVKNIDNNAVQTIAPAKNTVKGN
jgi:hypothetical protein